MRYGLLLLLAVSGCAFGQYDDLAQQAQLTGALNELQARTLYLETGMTPGDWNKLSDSEKIKVARSLQCKQVRDQIDEQLSLERAGHVGFYDWHNLRAAEKQACGDAAYRLGASPNDVAATKTTQDRPPPRYPIEALRAGHQGTVEVEVHINRDGSVRSAQVTQSSGFTELDKAAVESAYHWTLDPRGGSTQTWPVHFRLSH